MTRRIHDMAIVDVTPEAAIVAPHRYLWAGTIRPDGMPAKDLDLCDDYKERKANFPYVRGEIVYIDRNGEAVKARIVSAFFLTRREREEYHVQYVTKAGTWSRVWIMAYPGTIQRGYQRAGLAPDLDEYAPLKGDAK